MIAKTKSAARSTPTTGMSTKIRFGISGGIMPLSITLPRRFNVKRFLQVAHRLLRDADEAFARAVEIGD